MTLEQYRHVGAYGLLEHEGEILLILKTRGPYRGWYDLPGGGIEFGEEPLDALRREFVEETGLSVVEQRLLGVMSNRVLWQTDSGESEDLHHIGLIYAVAVAHRDGLITEPDGEDSGGAVWIARENLKGVALTPFARAAIEEKVAGSAQFKRDEPSRGHR